MFKTEDKISIEPAEMIEMSEWQAEKLSSTVIFALWGFDLYIFRRFCGKLNSKCRFHAEQNRDCLLACLSRFFYSSIAVYSWSEKSTKNANIYTFAGYPCKAVAYPMNDVVEGVNGMERLSWFAVVAGEEQKGRMRLK